MMNEKISRNEKITRRNFLKVLGGTVLGGVLVGCDPEKKIGKIMATMTPEVTSALALTPTTVPTETATATTAPSETAKATPPPEVQIGLPETYDQVKTVQEKDLPKYMKGLVPALWNKIGQENIAQGLTNSEILLKANNGGIREIMIQNKEGGKIDGKKLPVQVWSWTKVIEEDGTKIDLLGVPYEKGIVFFWFDDQWTKGRTDIDERIRYVNNSENIFNEIKQQKVSNIFFNVLMKYTNSSVEELTSQETFDSWQKWFLSGGPGKGDYPEEYRTIVYQVTGVGNIYEISK
jgi:hypothetical protein